MSDFTIEIGLFAKPLEEQLKEFNIPKKETDVWEGIADFIIRQSIKHNITERQEQKLFKGLFEEIKNYIQKHQKVKNYIKNVGERK